MLQYSIVNILKGVQFDIRYSDSSGKIGQVRDQMSFNRTISTLLMNLTNQAALGDYRRKLATGDAQVEGNEQLRACVLVQCTPNLEEFDCFNCLRILINFTLPDCCYGRQGAWVFVPSCSIKYDKYQFYNSTNALPPLKAPSPTPSSLSLPPHSIISRTKGNRSKKSTVAAIILPTTTPLLLLLILACHYLRRRRKPLEKIENEDEDKTVVVDPLKMDFDIIKAATDNFSDSNRLGYGGFGAVYKGRLSNGQAIAVKRLNKTSGQGRQEFRNEALLMAKLQHRNLLRFIGFCIQKDEKLLIHELLPNKSLDYFLFDPNKRIYLDWQKRYNIIQVIARGLLYLHEESQLLVIHRDLKPSNILLDMEMNPKISDFGMARIFGADQSQANTSKIIGTYGYMAPEYVSHGQFSIKTDVFSFGVLVLEIVSGQKVSGSSEADNGESLLSLAWRGWLEGNALSLVDSTMSDVNAAQVLRCINIGLLCVQENATQRLIMSSVVLMLNSYTVTVPVASRPAFQAQSDGESEALNLTKQMNS